MSNALAYRGPECPSPGTVRIILLGGSTTYGYGVNDDQTIDAYMRSLLPEHYPGRHFEVVNGARWIRQLSDSRTTQADGSTAAKHRHFEYRY